MTNGRALLVCHVSADVGIGHLSRLLATACVLKKQHDIESEFLIFGDVLEKEELSNFNVHNCSNHNNFFSKVSNLLQSRNIKVLILDLYPNLNIDNLGNYLREWKLKNINLISIDSLFEHHDILDLIWVPSFNFDPSHYRNSKCIVKSGWDSFLIQKRLNIKKWIPGSKVLILTGGSDVAGLGKILPSQLDKLLDKNTDITWVKGPFSQTPILPKKSRLKWTVSVSPETLDDLIVNTDYVMTIFGVSFFEVLQYGIPTVVFSAYNHDSNNDLNDLVEQGVALVAKSTALAIDGLITLIKNEELARQYSMNALLKMKINGTKNFSNEIYSLIKSK